MTTRLDDLRAAWMGGFDAGMSGFYVGSDPSVAEEDALADLEAAWHNWFAEWSWQRAVP